MQAELTAKCSLVLSDCEQNYKSSLHFSKTVHCLNDNNIYLLQLGCHPVAVVILHVYKTLYWLLLNLSREGYMRSM